MKQAGEFTAYIRSAVVVGLIAVLVAVVVLVIDARFSTSSWTIAISAIASTVLAVGLFTVLYDALLKRIFTNELLQLIEISTALRTAGVDAIAQETKLDWERLFTHASDFKFVLVDPTGWLERVWPHVLAAARSRKVQIDVCLPKSDGAAIPTLAQQLHLDPADYKTRLDAASTSMSDSWRSADPPLTPDSTLTVYAFDGAPAYGLVAADHRVVIMIHGALGRAALDSALAVSFNGDTGSYPTSWLLAQVRLLTALGVVYSNKVELHGG
jgi:hypothetical protein